MELSSASNAQKRISRERTAISVASFIVLLGYFYFFQGLLVTSSTVLLAWRAFAIWLPAVAGFAYALGKGYVDLSTPCSLGLGGWFFALHPGAFQAVLVTALVAVPFAVVHSLVLLWVHQYKLIASTICSLAIAAGSFWIIQKTFFHGANSLLITKETVDELAWLPWAVPIGAYLLFAAGAVRTVHRVTGSTLKERFRERAQAFFVSAFGAAWTGVLFSLQQSSGRAAFDYLGFITPTLAICLAGSAPWHFATTKTACLVVPVGLISTIILYKGLDLAYVPDSQIPLIGLIVIAISMLIYGAALWLRPRGAGGAR